MAEFEPTSLWYAATLTITAGWISTGGTVSYNVISQPPDSLRSQLKRLGLDVEGLEAAGRLRIFDWYSATLGQKSKEKLAVGSLKVQDLSLTMHQQMQQPKVVDRLLIVDNNSLQARFNEENSWVQWLITRGIPSPKQLDMIGIGGFVRGAHGEGAYKTLEATFDGVLEFGVHEEGLETRDAMRIRSMRSIGYDRRWHRLKVEKNLVTLENQ